MSCIYFKYQMIYSSINKYELISLRNPTKKIAEQRSMETLVKLTVLLFCISISLLGQETKIHSGIRNVELKMTFPSIYFKHKSTDYCLMPYSVDSCLKYIAANIKRLNSYPIWRDSSEIELLTASRILKIKADLNKFTTINKIKFQTMGNKQKISQLTINKSADQKQREYLLSLNSVLDVSGTILQKNKLKKKGHPDRPRIWCFSCWKNHRFSKSYRLHLKKKKEFESKKINI